MITKEQCRAARSFLGVKQADLAKMCGLSKTAITHFESGLFTPRHDNMVAIQTALESRGIEFIGTTGVQKKETASRVLEGETMLVELYEDIFSTLKEKGGEVCIAYLDEKPAYEIHPDELNAHLQRLRDNKITERLIVCEGDDFFVQAQECYRWLPYNIYKAGSMFFVYGNKVATQIWNGQLTVIIENKDVAALEQKRFEYLWDIAKVPYSTQ